MMKWVLLFIASAASVAVGRLIAAEDGAIDEIQHLVAREASNTCTSEYQALSKPSTYCATDSPNYVAGSAGVSEADKAIILERHNTHRAAASPTATDMVKMYWDEELAKGAEKLARQCYSGHDSGLGLTREVPKYGVNPGQNAASGQNDWTAAVDAWHSEVSMFKYGEDPAVYRGNPDGWKDIAHYTQVMQSRSALIGCGFAECTNGYKKFYKCNYIYGNFDVQKPYTQGDSCAACSGKCNGKLCDCGGLYCFNGGTLDLNTCTCNCLSLYKGDKCLEKNCPAGDDPWPCNGQWTTEHCSYSNVPPHCPKMCGLCPA